MGTIPVHGMKMFLLWPCNAYHMDIFSNIHKARQPYPILPCFIYYLDLPAIMKKFRKNTFDFPRLKIYFPQIKIRWKKLARAFQNFIERFNLSIENMALFKCFWTAPRGSLKRFNLLIENMALFKCSSTVPRSSWNGSTLQLKIWRGSNMCKTVQNRQH